MQRGVSPVRAHGMSASNLLSLFQFVSPKRNTFPATLVRSSPVARYRKLACQLPKSAKCKHSAHYSTPVNGECSVLSLTALFTRFSRCIVYARLRVPVRSGVPAVLSSCRPCFMLPARLSACPVCAPHGFLFWFTVQFRGSRFRFACLLTFKSISHFRLFVKWKVRCFNPFPNQKRRHSLDTVDYSTFETVCQELFSSAGNFRLPAP